jgi:hypothetical protein
MVIVLPFKFNVIALVLGIVTSALQVKLPLRGSNTVSPVEAELIFACVSLALPSLSIVAA